MAASENQGLQIAVIIFVVLTIILSVTTVVFWREWNGAEVEIETLRADSQQAQQVQREMQSEANKLKELMGTSQGAKIDEVVNTHGEDMKQFAASIPEDQRFYRQALEYLYNATTQANEQLVSAKDEIESLKQLNEAREGAKNPQIEQALAAQQKAADDLAAAQTAFTQELGTKNEMIDSEKARADKAQQELASAAEQTKAEIEGREQRIGLLSQTVQEQRTKINELIPSMITPTDGRITWVNPKTMTVWINVGEADALRRHVSFGVYAPDEAIGQDPKPKGRIEVTQILGPHHSEARIHEDQFTDPIIPGDVIFTPLWHPGRNEHFGIVGVIDIDGDGISDRKLLNDIITMNGGVIDAQVDDEGNRTGKLSINTRALIIGGEPEDAAVAPYSDLRKEAQQLGVNEVNLPTFLDHIGWKDTKQLYRYGRDGNIDSIRPDLPDGGMKRSRGNVSDYFKMRLPPTGAAAPTPQN